MNMKQKWRRFGAFQSKANDGFTLVELIVVIAIVAVLGGVAVPAYSGYIEKADRTADKQLLADVNKAFAAACMVEGVNNFDADVNDPTIGGDKKIGEIKVVGVPEFNKTFRDFFDNEGEFKKTTRLEYKAEIGGFFDPDADTEGKRAFTIGGKTYYISQSAIDRFKAATAFSEHIDELQDRINGLTGSYDDVVKGYTPEQLGEKFGEDYEEFIKNFSEEERGNATVLYIAKKTAGMTSDDAYKKLFGAYTTLSTLNDNDWSKTIEFDAFSNALGSGNDTLGTTAMLYGAITAYANGEGKGDATLQQKLKDVHDSGSLMSAFSYAIGNTSFMDYCSQKDENGAIVLDENGVPSASNQFTTDMNGYLGALEGINSSSGAFEGDLSNDKLWTGSNAEELLGQIMK